MGAIDRFLRRNRGQDNIKPLMKRLESAMLNAVKAAGGSAWYVPDDFLVLGPELLSNGDFSQGASGWGTNGSTVDTSSGSCAVTVSTTSGRIEQSHSSTGKIQAGKQYLVSADIKSASTISSVINVIRGSAGSYATIAVSNTVAAGVSATAYVAFTAPADDAVFQVKNNSGLTSGTFICDNISVREIQSAKDWQDSAGTLPSYLGGTVGLALDATGTAAAELVADVDLNDPSNWNLAAVSPATSTIAGGRVRIYSPAGENASAIQAFSRGVATLGKLYKFTIDVEAYTGQAGVHFAGSGAVLIPAGVGVKTVYAVADGAQFGVKRTGACDITINSISVKEITGNVVTQATAANRPTITRIPRKLGPELATGVSINGTNGTNTGSATANSFTISQVDSTSVVNAVIQLSKLTTPGTSYLLSSTPSALSGSYFKVDATAWLPTAAQVTANTVLTATNAPASQIIVYRGATPAAGTFSNVSVREVLEWSYALSFDGSNDSLASPASIIGATLTQPYTMIAWGRTGAMSVTRRIVGDSIRALGIDGSGKISIAHNGVGSRVGTTSIVAGQAFVAEVTWDGATSNLFMNGLAEGSGPHSAPSGTAAPTSIGQYGSASSYWIGDIGGVVVCPAVMTDAQRSAVRKFAAAQMGLSL